MGIPMTCLSLKVWRLSCTVPTQHFCRSIYPAPWKPSTSGLFNRTGLPLKSSIQLAVLKRVLTEMVSSRCPPKLYNHKHCPMLARAGSVANHQKMQPDQDHTNLKFTRTQCHHDRGPNHIDPAPPLGKAHAHIAAHRQCYPHNRHPNCPAQYTPLDS